MKISLLLSSTTAALICVGLTACNGNKIQSAMNDFNCQFHTSSCTPRTASDYTREYDEAIARNPQNAKAYYERAAVKRYNPRIMDFEGALADFNQAIALAPKMAAAYVERGSLNARRKDFQGALADYNQLISLYSQYPKSGTEYTDDLKRAYYHRASVKDRLADARGAVADYDTYIALNPESANAYKLRAALKADELQDFQGALADYKKALSLSKTENIISDFSPPEDDDIGEMQGERESYGNRAKLKAKKLKNPQAAIAYYNELIELLKRSEDILYEHIYLRRADVKANKLKDYRGALSDYNREIEIASSQVENNLSEAELYLTRGTLKYLKLSDRAGGIADTKKALQSAKKEDNTEVSNMAIAQLKSWGIDGNGK